MTPRAAAGAMDISPAPAIAVVFSAPALVSPPTNAAPEWQAGSLRGRSRELMVACRLEGRVIRPFAYGKMADLQISNASMSGFVS